MQRNVKKLSKEFARDWQPGRRNKTAFAQYCQPVTGTALVVGSKVYKDKKDRRELYPKAIGIDLFEGDGVDAVHDITTAPYSVFDHVDCVSMLEHCQKPWLAAENMVKSLKPGGTILVSVPFMWRMHAYPDDYFRFTPQGVASLFDGIEWEHLKLMCCGVEVKRNPAIATKFDDDAYIKSEVWGWGIKK